MKACMYCIVNGRVQGVFFRGSAQQEARRLGLVGWARNRPDGSVEVMACGDRDSLEAMRGWLQEGPPEARVDGVEVEHKPFDESLDGFSVA